MLGGIGAVRTRDLGWLQGLGKPGVSGPSSLSLGGNTGASDWMCTASSFCRGSFYIVNRCLGGLTNLKGTATTAVSLWVCGLDGASPLAIIQQG